jgi:glycosyltransferase involved in cell wall biosynthesis
VPTQDVAALSNAIAEVFHRRQTDIGNQSGLRIAQEKYALAKMVADYEKLFRRN